MEVEVWGTGKAFHHAPGHDLFNACEWADHPTVCFGPDIWFTPGTFHILEGNTPSRSAALQRGKIHAQVAGGLGGQRGGFGRGDATHGTDVPGHHPPAGTSARRLSQIYTQLFGRSAGGRAGLHLGSLERW